MDNVESLRALRGDFPELSIGGLPDPFGKRLEFWSATTQFVYEAALFSCGPSDVVEWQKRLCAVEDIVSCGLDDPGAVIGSDGPSGLTVTAILQPSLVFAEIYEPEAYSAFPAAELHGSLALWLLVQAHKAAQGGDLGHAKDLEIQATLSIALSLGEGARVVQQSGEKERRVRNAKRAARARHAKDDAKRDVVLADYRAERWTSKNRAAVLLALKHGGDDESIRKWLKRERPLVPAASG